MNFLKRIFGSQSTPATPATPASGTPSEPPKPVILEKEDPVVTSPEPVFDLDLAKMQTVYGGIVVDPFSKVNYWVLPNGGKRVRVYFLMERPIEGAQTGLAIDGSASMKGPFGRLLLGTPPPEEVERYRKRGMVTTVTQDKQQFNRWSQEAVDELVRRGIFHYTDNIVQSQARDMTSYLSKFDADGGTTVVYWATGDGQQLEEVGDLTSAQCLLHKFEGPQRYGNTTHLLPAVKYFVNRFVDARWGMYVFITDGRLDDLNAVKKYCIDLARRIEQGKRNDLKLVLIGVGDEIDENQMEELDNLDSGTSVDLWDHKIAKDMKQLAEIFAEVVSETVVVVPNDGVIRDANKNIVKDYRDSGLPALMVFDLPKGSEFFTLEVGGQVAKQSFW